VVARFFTVYGESDAHAFGAIPSAIRSFAEGRPVVCKSPWAIRDYVYARDAAAAILAILQSPARGVVNVASGRPRTMREVFSVIAEEMNCPHLLSFDEGNTSSDILAADVSRLTDELNFKCGTDFRDGVRNCIDEFFKTRGQAAGI
jgi:nucleoside-diphosphate-sugar epimerase